MEIKGRRIIWSRLILGLVVSGTYGAIAFYLNFK